MKKWFFPSVMNIGIKGFNDIGEEFKDNPMYHLAKEICQNSLDTKVTDSYVDNGKPIKVEFKEFWINPSDIPGNENMEFRNVIEEEVEFNDKYYKIDKTVPEFYKHALCLLNSDSIRCLRISDFNTPGLIGSNKKSHTPWSDLTKNAGVTDKPEGSAGSKGKGKFASFICSELYTVFYSTKSNDGLEASCGISRITGYEKDDGTVTIGEGYYEDNYNPLNSCLNLDCNFRRYEYGTDIYIIGFKNSENWKERMCASIIENFFVAIFNGDLIIDIGNEYEITQSTIGELIDNTIIAEYLLPDTKCYYNLLISDKNEVLSKTESMFENEDVKLILRKDDVDLNDINKVATVRLTGMKILDMIRLPRLGKYHGILFMRGLKVNDYFRKLENATHSNWSPDRIQNSAEASRKIRDLRSFVIKAINELMAGSILEEIDATGVGETLPDEDNLMDNNDINRNESIENEKIKTIDIIPKKLNNIKKEQKSFSDDETNEIGLELDENGLIIKKERIHTNVNPIPGPPDPNPIPPKEHRYSEVNKEIVTRKIRLISTNGFYKLIFSLKDFESIVKIDIYIYGESGTEKALITNAKCRIESKLIKNNVPIEIYDNSIILKCLSDENIYDIEFEIESDGVWPLEVKVYGTK